ncbi:hypothetical protein OROGR_008333 [Orobanche gracilis]
MCTSTTTKGGLSSILLTLIIVITFHAFPAFGGCGLFSKKYKIGISNIMPRISEGHPRIFKVHCASGDVELGYRELASENSFYWDVCLSDFWGETLFFCHFWYKDNEAVFDVFNWDISKDCFPKYDCLWEVNEVILALRTDDLIVRRIHLWGDTF